MKLLRQLSANNYRILSYQVDGTLLRYEKFYNTDYLVCPVVAMIGDSVVWSATAPAPEFVPASVLELSVPGWGYRPVVMNHPMVDNLYVSANSPRVLEGNKFGFAFYPRFTDDNKLVIDAYLNPAEAENIPEAKDIITRLQNNEIVEVSCGQFVLMREESGEVNGQPYYAVWEQILPDHLAMLSEGTVGACSVEMGCGANRFMVGRDGNKRTVVVKQQQPAILEVATVSEPNDRSDNAEVNEPKLDTAIAAVVDPRQRGLMQRFVTWMSKASGNNHNLRDNSADDSYRELWDKLYEALRTQVPMFMWLEDIRYSSQVVIYSTDTVDYSSYEKLWQRGYTINDKDEVVLLDNVEELKVKRTTVYETFAGVEIPAEKIKTIVADLATNTDLHSQCSCKGDRLMGNETSVDNQSKDEEKEKETAINTPVVDPAVSPASPATPPAAPATPATTPTTAAPATVEISTEELENLRAVASLFKAQEGKRREGLVSVLKTASKFTEDKLKGMKTDDLITLADSLGVLSGGSSHDLAADYSGVRLAGGYVNSDDDDNRPPRIMSMADLIKNKSAGGNNKSN